MIDIEEDRKKDRDPKRQKDRETGKQKDEQTNRQYNKYRVKKRVFPVQTNGQRNRERDRQKEILSNKTVCKASCPYNEAC